MTRKGPPTGVERRASPRLSYAADRNRAALIALGIHAAIILLLIVGLPYLPRQDVPLAQNPIAVTMVMNPPDPEITPDPQPPVPEASQDQSAASSEAPAQEAEDAAQPPTAPLDPGFNPFALAPRSEVQESQPDVAPPAPAPAAPAAMPAPAPTQQAGGDGGEAGQGQGQEDSGPGIGGPTSGGGSLTGDIKWKEQYLFIHSFGRSLSYRPELKKFLLRVIDCGVVPIDSHAQGLMIEADVVFAPNGTVQFAKLTNPASFAGDPGYNKAAHELMAALARPGCAYVVLPSFDYMNWRMGHLSFFQRTGGP